MKITFFYRVKPKTSTYKPVFYVPEEEQSPLEKRIKNYNDTTTPLRERLNKQWEEGRKHKGATQRTFLVAAGLIAGLIYYIFFY